MKRFDWAPHLRSGERLVWQGGHDKRRLAYMSLPMILLFLSVIYLDDGTSQIHRVAQAAPFVIVFLVAGLFYMSVTHDHYAVTDQRAISVRIAPWHGPRVRHCDISRVQAVKWPKSPLMFRDRQTDKALVMMTVSGRDVSEVMAIVNGRPE